MKSRLIIPGLLVTAGLTVALWTADARRGHAQEGCPTGQVCNPAPCPPPPPPPDLITVLQETPSDCTTETATFTPTMDTWNYIFDPNNAIKISTDVLCPAFELKVDRIRISQDEYALRRDPAFADTVCNPTFDPTGVLTDCVFYRLHGEFVPRGCYPTTPIAVEYKIFWNNPPIQGNKHDWMLLRAECSEFAGDPNVCDNTQLFSENVTLFVDRKPPVGTDPVVGGGGDGISDFIVAISTKHPHKGIPPTPF